MSTAQRFEPRIRSDLGTTFETIATAEEEHVQSVASGQLGDADELTVR